MRGIAQIFRGVEGTEILEAALVLPLLFMFLLGIVWFGRAFNIYSTITQAAQRGAMTAARPTCATCTPGNTFPPDSAVDNSVHSVTDASNLDQNQIQPHAPSTTPTFCPAPPSGCSASTSRITVCRSVWLNNPSTPAQCGVIVSFQYPFQFYLPFTSLSLQQVNLTAEAQSRMEN